MNKIKTITIEPVTSDMIINTLNKIESDFADIILDRKDLIKMELLRTLNSVCIK